MKKEIGSEFWSVPVRDKSNNVFPDNTQWYLSGRSALTAIIQHLGYAETAALPSWCCDSMIKPFLDAGIKVFFYPVYYDNRLIQEPYENCDILMVMDYFGYTSDLEVKANCIIRDVTHSVFSGTYDDADYYIGSLRKWCGVWTGGYAWTKDKAKLPENKYTNKDYIKLRAEAMAKKARYINDLSSDKQSYLQLFSQAEDLLDQANIEKAAERDVELAKVLDVELIRGKRRTNAATLIQAFSEWTIFPLLSETDCPLFVPIIVPDGKRDALRQFLIKHNIYCPVHWPVSEYHDVKKCDSVIYDNELSLVCDQRYDVDDMYHVIDMINKFFKEQ